MSHAPAAAAADRGQGPPTVGLDGAACGGRKHVDFATSLKQGVPHALTLTILWSK